MLQWLPLVVGFRLLIDLAIETPIINMQKLLCTVIVAQFAGDIRFSDGISVMSVSTSFDHARREAPQASPQYY